jgi:hypothetical protein
MNLSHRPTLPFGAGVVLLALASCGAPVSDDAIEAYCKVACPPENVSAGAAVSICTSMLESEAREAEGASCGDAFLAFFRCAQQEAPNSGDCGEASACYPERSALVACEDADPADVCRRGAEHVAACASEAVAQQLFGSSPCGGNGACVAFCFLGASCDEISTYYPQRVAAADGLQRCLQACPLAEADGTIAWLTGD